MRLFLIIIIVICIVYCDDQVSAHKKREKKEASFMFYAFDVRTGSAWAKPQQQQWRKITKEFFIYFKRDKNDPSISVSEPPKIKFFSPLSSIVMIVAVDSYQFHQLIVTT